MWFGINPSLSLPIYLQIVRQVEDAVERGILLPGDRLPPVRELAVDSAVNPNTVARAYRELERKGLLETRRGAGTFVRRVPMGARSGEVLAEEIDGLLAEAGRRGIGAAELLRLVEKRILGSDALREEERK